MSDAREYLTNVGPGPAPDSSRYRQWWEMRNALLAVLDECDRLEARRFLWVVLPIRRAINDALGIRDDTRREGYEYP